MSEMIKGIGIYDSYRPAVKCVILYKAQGLCWRIFCREDVTQAGGVWCLMFTVKRVTQLIDAHTTIVTEQLIV